MEHWSAGKKTASGALLSSTPTLQCSNAPVFIFQPWRCLCLALVQITRITPLRLMILQFSQSFLTEARTFIFKISFVPQGYALATSHRATVAAGPFGQAQNGAPSSAPCRRQTPTIGGRWPTRCDTFRWAGLPRLNLQLGRDPLRPCQDLRFELGNQDRMLKMSGQ